VDVFLVQPQTFKDEGPMFFAYSTQGQLRLDPYCSSVSFELIYKNNFIPRVYDRPPQQNMMSQKVHKRGYSMTMTGASPASNNKPLFGTPDQSAQRKDKHHHHHQ
jgi:hypothetical protein